MDNYQKRYKAHQLRKKKTIMQIIKDRHSSRYFDKKPITVKQMDTFLEGMENYPSSCDRKGITMEIIYSRPDKEALSGLLVGALGWAYTANIIILFWGESTAYKENLDYMPFLDTGVMIGQAYLVCEALKLKCCFINPHIHKENLEIFNIRFNNPKRVFCGALALGH